MPSHTVSCNKKTSIQLLSALCWLFRGPVSTISVCRSIFLFATLQSAPRPFDPSPEPPEAARYWSDNGLEWFSWPPLRGRLLAPKTHPVEMSQFTSVSISASVSGFCSFCVRQKVDAFLLSVPCPMNRFPPPRKLRSDNISKLAETTGVKFMCLRHLIWIQMKRFSNEKWNILS